MWISTKEQLPEEGKFVLARHDLKQWIDSKDPENVNCVVVKLRKGISKSEREKLSDDDPRKNIWKGEDEYGNNKVPYLWAIFGADIFHGHRITHWQPIEPLNTKP